MSQYIQPLNLSWGVLVSKAIIKGNVDFVVVAVVDIYLYLSWHIEILRYYIQIMHWNSLCHFSIFLCKRICSSVVIDLNFLCQRAKILPHWLNGWNWFLFMYLLLLFPQLTACRNKGGGVCGSDQGRQTNMPDVCPSNSEGTGSHCHN